VHVDVTLRHFIHEATHEFLHLDGKIFRTLKLLVTKPGALTLEFFRGRRARYISPIRLYLTCSLLYFALAAIAPSDAKFEVTATDVPSPEVEEVIRRAEKAMEDLREKITHYAPRAMFLLLPLFALLTWRFYRSAQPFYVPHVYYALHFHAFVFLVFAVAKMCQFGGTVGDAVGGVLALLVIPYHYVSLRRVFGGSRGQVAWKGTATMLIYTLTIAAIFLAVLAAQIKSIIAGARLHSS
jgi:hypothetical protein